MFVSAMFSLHGSLQAEDGQASCHSELPKPVLGSKDREVLSREMTIYIQENLAHHSKSTGKNAPFNFLHCAYTSQGSSSWKMKAV